MTLTLHHAVRSDVGYVREGNEDAGYAGSRLIAVADGMGGQAAGEVASRVAIARLAALDEDGGGPDLLSALQQAVMTANEDLRAMVMAEPELEGMGTTVTAMLASGPRLALAHIGDSRAYLYREGQLAQITHDHTLVQSLVDDGQLSADEAATHPKRSLLLRALDGRQGVELDLSIREARPGDRYLLCTDGLSGVVSDDTIAAALALPTPEEAVARLVELALRGGGPDNVTAVVADVREGEEITEPVIAGAAAEGPDPLGGDGGPAARAAAASGQRERARQAPGRPVDAQNGARRGRRRGWLGTLALPVVVLLVLGAGLAGTWIYIHHQYYVGTDGSQVAIFRGVSGSVGPIHLSQVVEVDMPLSALPPVARSQVRQGIPANGLADARRIVGQLRSEELAALPAATTPTTPTTSPAAPPTTPAAPAVSPGATP